MRIVAWNIRAGGGVRAERIAAQLLAWEPSLVVLSEFRATPPSRRLAALLRESGLIHQRSTATPKDAATNALLVASRWRIRRLPTRFSAEEPQRWLPVSVAAPLPFLVGAVHIPCRVSGRKNAFHDAVVSVARRWRRRPALLIGDTNSGLPGIDEEAPCFGAGEQAFFAGIARHGYADAFRMFEPDKRVFTWYSPNGRNGFRLDQGFVSAPLWRPLSKAAYRWGGGRDGGLSDHAALHLDFLEPASLGELV